MAIPQVVSAGEWRQAREELLIAEKEATRTQVALAGGGFLLNAFLRDGDEVYRTYTTGSRGVDRLMFVNNIQDLSVYGRQEDWEDSPEGGHSSDPQLTVSARSFTWLSEAGGPAPRTQLASDASPGDGAGNARTPRQSRHR